MWLFSNAELGGYTTSSPYKDEGTKYPLFTNDNSRKKYLADGAGASTYWWERDPHVGISSSFVFCHTSGYPNGSNYANSANGVCLGFCSGEAAA